MKFTKAAKESKDLYSKYKIKFGEHYDQLITICKEWELYCSKNMFDSSNLHNLLESNILTQIEQIDKELKASTHGSQMKTFLIEMINSQHTELLIPYLRIEHSLPQEFANIHVGFLGSGTEIFDIMKINYSF